MQIELKFELEDIVRYFDFDKERDNRVSKIYNDFYWLFPAFYRSTGKTVDYILNELENLYGEIFGCPIDLKVASAPWGEELARKINQRTESYTNPYIEDLVFCFEETTKQYLKEILLIDRLTQSLDSVVRRFYNKSIENIPEEVRTDLNKYVDNLPHRVILDEEVRKFVDWFGEHPEADEFKVDNQFKENLRDLFYSLKALSDFYKNGEARPISGEMWRLSTIDNFNRRFGRIDTSDTFIAVCKSQKIYNNL